MRRGVERLVGAVAFVYAAEEKKAKEGGAGLVYKQFWNAYTVYPPHRVIGNSPQRRQRKASLCVHNADRDVIFSSSQCRILHHCGKLGHHEADVSENDYMTRWIFRTASQMCQAVGSHSGKERNSFRVAVVGCHRMRDIIQDAMGL